ncbi:hypothetical protein OMP38_19250 [Cohnella ginsengisoli]|uniref:Tail tape measure protein n=1 Tax=Cohnella ginsengisoli TaxID=425004 RepID=A0A9X4QNM4_9BACL|nr:hypothetical protein [Cohnella ginsengisoli]MDG0792771.1 hypothetical protein [Cohnella ginsengisoli]
MAENAVPYDYIIDADGLKESVTLLRTVTRYMDSIQRRLDRLSRMRVVIPIRLSDCLCEPIKRIRTHLEALTKKDWRIRVQASFTEKMKAAMKVSVKTVVKTSVKTVVKTVVKTIVNTSVNVDVRVTALAIAAAGTGAGAAGGQGPPDKGKDKSLWERILDYVKDLGKEILDVYKDRLKEWAVGMIDKGIKTLSGIPGMGWLKILLPEEKEEEKGKDNITVKVNCVCRCKCQGTSYGGNGGRGGRGGRGSRGGGRGARAGGLLGRAVGGLGRALGGLIRTVGKGLIVKTLLGGGKRIAGRALSAGKAVAGKALEKGRMAAGQVLGKGRAAAGQVIDKGKAVAGRAASAVKNAASSAWDAGKSTAGRLWSGEKALAGQALDKGKNAAGRAAGAVKSAASNAWGVGKALWGKLRRGGDLADKAGDIVSAPASGKAFKRLLKVGKIGGKLLRPLGAISDVASIVTAKNGDERAKAIGSAAGGWAGAAGGAAMGAAIGSIIPGIGTAIGGLVGGAIGGLGGSAVGEKLGSYAKKAFGWLGRNKHKKKNDTSAAGDLLPSNEPASSSAKGFGLAAIQAGGLLGGAAISRFSLGVPVLPSVQQLMNRSLSQIQALPAPATPLNPTNPGATRGQGTSQSAPTININIPAGAVQLTVKETEIDYNAITAQVGTRLSASIRQTLENRP